MRVILPGTWSTDELFYQGPRVDGVDESYPNQGPGVDVLYTTRDV
jgi:hypothetical protein